MTRDASDRVCVVHVGTHKTGSTSLQYFLQTNDAQLERAGLHFVHAGWYGVVPGNHNLAWEILRGERGPYTQAFLDELAHVHHSSILSSEEFSLLHDRPQGLANLLEWLREHGAQPKILMYVRAQAEFVESLYVEQIKHGQVRPFSGLLSEVLATGTYRMPERTVAVRYGDSARAFAALAGSENVLLRPYARRAESIVIFHDFMQSLERLVPGFHPTSLTLELAHPRINESLNFGALLAYTFVHLQPQIGLPDDADRFFSERVPEVPRALLGERYALLTYDEVARFIETFDADNRALEQRYGMRIPGTRIEDLPPASHPQWERARTMRATFDACVEAWGGSTPG